MTDIIEEVDIVDSPTDFIGDALTGIPAPIKKNAFKAFAQLCTVAIDIPVAHLEGIASEKRAETQARISIINTGANQISEQMNIDPEYAKVAVKKYGQRIIRERVNLDIIAEKASEEIKKNSIPNQDSSSIEEEISEDWLNSFEKEASQKSSEDMQNLFSRILAGEISNPSTFSIRSIKTISQLDNEVAQLFHIFCSLCIHLKYNGKVVDARVVSLNGNASTNSLRKYGLDFTSLNVLEEYGLIISDYNSQMNYGSCIVNGKELAQLPFIYNSNKYVVINHDEKSKIDKIQLPGVMLTKVGKELFQIIDVEENKEYTEDFMNYFKGKQLTMQNTN